MRLLFGFFGTAVVAAVVATVWVALLHPDLSLIGSISLPRWLGTLSAELTIGLRRLQALREVADRPAAAGIVFATGIVVFLILNLPGWLGVKLFGFAFAEEERWVRLLPVVGAVAFAVMASVVVLMCVVFGLPPFAGLKPSPLMFGAASAVAGLLYGFGALMPED